MTTIRIALASLAFPDSRDHSVTLARGAVHAAATAGAAIVCFPECYVPGYRARGRSVAPPDAAWLGAALARIGAAAREAQLTVVLGTERVVDSGVHASAVVIGRDGDVVGAQDKVQIDPSEEGLYAPGSGRHVFEAAGVTFGVTICHEGWRYPETVRWGVATGLLAKRLRITDPSGTLNSPAPAG